MSHRYSVRIVCGMAVVVLSFSDWMDNVLPAQDVSSTRKILEDALTVFAPLPKAGSGGAEGDSPDQIELGRKLFFDPRISADGVRSCMLCHQPSLYGTDGLSFSRGVDNQLLGRNAPTVLNSALQFRIHWDGRFSSVDEQAQAALRGPGFQNSSDEVAVSRIKAIPGYEDLFRQAFPEQKDPVTTVNWGHAIGAYERTLVTPAPFDEFLSGAENRLTEAQLRGLSLFKKSGCADCHSGALLGGQSYEKFGVTTDYWNETKSNPIDKGRSSLTKKEDDLYSFKVAPLRNVAMTAPYFHDGSVQSLPAAVQVMAKVQLGTTFKREEVRDVVSFLECLTGTIPPGFAQVPQLPPGPFLQMP